MITPEKMLNMVGALRSLYSNKWAIRDQIYWGVLPGAVGSVGRTTGPTLIINGKQVYQDGDFKVDLGGDGIYTGNDEFCPSLHRTALRHRGQDHV